MTLDEGLRNFLLGDMAIAALVVDLGQAEPINQRRVYPIRLPQKPMLPAITFQQITDYRTGHLRGTAGTARPRYQIDTYDRMPKGAKTLAGLVRQRMDGFKGVFSDGASPATTIPVQGIYFETAIDLFDEDILGGSSRNSADYFVTIGTMAGVF